MVWIKSETGLIMKSIIEKYKTDLLGVGIGAIAGFLYWKFIGCASGTCMITSKPLNSSLYGALMGFLVVVMFKKEKLKNKKYY